MEVQIDELQLAKGSGITTSPTKYLCHAIHRYISRKYYLYVYRMMERGQDSNSMPFPLVRHQC